MEDKIIQSVGQIESDIRTNAIYQLSQNQLFKVTDAPAPVAQPEKTAEKQPQSLLPVTNGDVFLRFMVDETSNDITVYVVDRASRRIMRSIPPNEVNNLKAGDLLKLFA